MNLLKEDFFEKLRKKRNMLMIIFIILALVFLTAYIFSFYINILWVSILTGVLSVIILVLFYYGLIFDKNKLLKLFKNVNSGIYQEDTYFFKKFDDYTEHDGVRLLRVICTFNDENEVFERTLYFLCALPYPDLTEGQKIKVKTHQNIIINIED